MYQVPNANQRASPIPIERHQYIINPLGRVIPCRVKPSTNEERLPYISSLCISGKNDVSLNLIKEKIKPMRGSIVKSSKSSRSISSTVSTQARNRPIAEMKTRNSSEMNTEYISKVEDKAYYHNSIARNKYNKNKTKEITPV